MNKDAAPKIIGATLGIALALFIWVYLPMSRNYAECGKVTLCERKCPK